MSGTILIISNVTNGLFLFRRELIERLVQEYDVEVLAGDTGSVDNIRNLGRNATIERAML